MSAVSADCVAAVQLQLSHALFCTAVPRESFIKVKDIVDKMSPTIDFIVGLFDKLMGFVDQLASDVMGLWNG